MTISLLDPKIPIPVPRLKDGKLDASALCTWLRECADASARTGNSDWQRAAMVHRAALLAELRARVDWRLVSAARRTRTERITAEDVLHAARTALEEPSQERAVARVTGQLPRADRQRTVEQALAALIAARNAEQAASSALRVAAMPIYQEQHARAGFLLQETQRATKALVDDSRHALRVIEQLDPEQLLLEAHDEP